MLIKLSIHYCIYVYRYIGNYLLENNHLRANLLVCSSYFTFIDIETLFDTLGAYSSIVSI